jgi:hypothetical protein
MGKVAIKETLSERDCLVLRSRQGFAAEPSALHTILPNLGLLQCLLSKSSAERVADFGGHKLAKTLGFFLLGSLPQDLSA